MAWLLSGLRVLFLSIIRKMLKNENIICISSIDWDFIWQGHQEIMSTFAMNGSRVLFIENTGIRAPGIKDISRIKHRIKNWFRGVEGIRKEMENLYIYSPLVLPFPYSRLARWLNRLIVLSILEKWIKVMDFGDPIVWTFLPTPLSLDMIDNLVKKLTIYYCIDNFGVSSASARKIKKYEVRLLHKADLVFSTSRLLYDSCSKYNGRVYNFPFGVNFSEFERARLNNNAIPEELKNLKRPIIGYVGGVHKWIDQGLVMGLAKRFPEHSFVFVGPLQTDVSSLAALKNIYFLGNKKHSKIPHFIKYFDLCIIPYIITDYTKNVYPTKLNEYLAMGKAVVSAGLPEVVEFNKKYKGLVYIGEDEKTFSECIEKAVFENTPTIIKSRIEASLENNWGSRIQHMSMLINEEIERKKLATDIKWKENLFTFYKAARRKALRLGTICILSYLLVFKTQFIWFLASPLRISDAPKKADVILVFGGGVGETGSPGKSTIERARYASELYNAGYANKIIFSSGYIYTYNDTDNMRFIALSMGVSDKDIVLEQKANNTYENVIFSKEILNKHNWKSVLLISSPYNMRRATLVFNKFANNIKIIYMPVQKSQFYDRSSGIKLEQIMAIIHEYLGIVYYFVKGYI